MTRFWPPESTIWESKRIEVHVAPTPAWTSSGKNKGKGTKWLASSGDTGSPALSPGGHLFGSNDEGHVRCASAKRKPAHTMSSRRPLIRTSCSGADPLQIHRSHCTITAKGSGNAPRREVRNRGTLLAWAAVPPHLRGIWRPEGYPRWQAAAPPVLCG